MRIDILGLLNKESKILSGTYHVRVGANPRQEVISLLELLAALHRQEIDLIVTSDRDSKAQWLGDGNLHPEALEFTGGLLTLSTSGTTGQPKRVTRHISAKVEKRGTSERNWVLCYPLDRWSGVSTLMEVLKSNSSISVPKDFSLASIIEIITNTQDASISLTPSLFKSIALSQSSASVFNNVNQVTFGGEYTNQNTLDEAKSIFPNARITHIYASSELGDFLVDSSGQEGYSWLKAQTRGATLDSEGELVVDGYHTGDIWDLVNERIYFKGRISEIINVGGNKVSPTHLTKVALGIEGIRDAYFYSIPNPLLGAVVGLKYVGIVDPKALKLVLRNLLPKFALPMKIEQVSQIELEANMKRRVVDLE